MRDFVAEYGPAAAPLHQMAEMIMNTRPDLEPMSLDEWFLEHFEELTGGENAAAQAILLMFEERGLT